MEYECYDEGGYCEQCDSSFASGDEVIIPFDQWHEQFGCPNCGDVYPKVYLNDAYYSLGLYLLSIADDEWAFPGDYSPRLPLYQS